MAEICQRIHHDHLIVVFVKLILFRPIHIVTENLGLASSVYLRSWYRLLWGKRKADLISTNNSKDFPPTPSDSNLNGFPWSLKVPILFHLHFIGENGDYMFMELQKLRHRPQNTCASSFLENLGKQVSLFKREYPKECKR